MSFSQQNRRLNEEPEYWYAFLTTKNGNNTRRFRTCTFVNLQFSFFSVPIWSGRMFMHSITLIIALIARLFSFSEKKDYYFICLRLAEDKSFIIDRSKLSITDYLSVLYHTDRPLSDGEARDLLYKTVHDVCTEDSDYPQLSRYAYAGKDFIIGPILFQVVNLAVYYLRKMDLTDVVHQFEIWNEGVQRAVLLWMTNTRLRLFVSIIF